MAGEFKNFRLKFEAEKVSGEGEKKSGDRPVDGVSVNDTGHGAVKKNIGDSDSGAERANRGSSGGEGAVSSFSGGSKSGATDASSNAGRGMSAGFGSGPVLPSRGGLLGSVGSGAVSGNGSDDNVRRGGLLKNFSSSSSNSGAVEDSVLDGAGADDSAGNDGFDVVQSGMVGKNNEGDEVDVSKGVGASVRGGFSSSSSGGGLLKKGFVESSGGVSGDENEVMGEGSISDSSSGVRFNFDKKPMKPVGGSVGQASGSPRFGVGADLGNVSFGAGVDVPVEGFVVDDFIEDDTVVDDVEETFEEYGVEFVGDSTEVVSSVSDDVVSDDESDVSVSGSVSGVISSVDVFNPFFDDEGEDETFMGFDGEPSVGVADGIGGSDVVDDGVVASESVVKASGKFVEDGGSVLSSSGAVGSVSVGADESGALRDRVREVASVPVVDESRGNDSRVFDSVEASELDSVVVERKRGPLAFDHGFSRQNVVEVVVGEKDDEGVDDVSARSVSGVEGVRKYNQHVRSNGKLNGKELEFFKNLGMSKSSPDVGKLELLRGSKHGQESVAERKARNVLYGQAIGGRELLSRNSKVRFAEKDREVLQLLVLFRYMTASHLARAFSVTSGTLLNRLRKLRRLGLVLDKAIFGTEAVWFVTEAGMLLSGFDLNRVTESGINFKMVPHQFTVNHVAANVWGANVNVLNLDDFPVKNRVNSKGVRVFGESVTSELEIQTVLSRLKGIEKADAFVPVFKENIESAFVRWERDGGVEFGESPEFLPGNEYMWALFPPANLRLAYHVPDLVVRRPRNEDGSPESIAVEVEISNKPAESYEKTLRAFRADDRIYKKMVWVCKNVSPARKLEKIGKELGLVQSGRLEVLPVLTEDGVFKGKDLWLI